MPVHFVSIACVAGVQEVTLICVIEGIKCYNREVYALAMRTVVIRLVGLMQDLYMGSVMKGLVTSALETRIARKGLCGLWHRIIR